jgi:hypothetical protein
MALAQPAAGALTITVVIGAYFIRYGFLMARLA